MATFIVLLLLLAALVGALVAFENFQSEIRASNRRVPAATKRALAPSRDALSTPQLVLIVLDRASLIARTDPGSHVISFISIPGSDYLRTPGGTTVAGVLGTTGATGLVRFARNALDLKVTHIALLRPQDVAPLVDAVGGIQIQDASSFGGFVPEVLDGADAQRYLARAGPSASRTRRQRAVLGAIVTRLSSATSLWTLPSLARTFSATVATDLSPRETLDLALVRLSSKHSIECGLPDGSTLEQAQSKDILQQFEGVRPTPQQQGRIFPANGCRAAPLSLPVPAAVSFFGKQALALFPFVPELAAVAIALDVMLLLAVLGVPQALIVMARRGRKGGRLDEAKPKSLSSTSESEVLADSVGAHTVQSRQSPVAAPAEMVQVNSPRSKRRAGYSPTRSNASGRPADEAIEEQATATPRGMEPFLPTPPRRVPRHSMSFARKPSLRRSEKLKAALHDFLSRLASRLRQVRRVLQRFIGRLLRHGGGFRENLAALLRQVRRVLQRFIGRLLRHGGGFRENLAAARMPGVTASAMFLGVTASAIFLGYLIGHM